MRRDGRITLYLWKSNVTNWPGSLSFPLLSVRVGKHNIARSQRSVLFVGPDGFVWSGRQYGENSDLCHCRRTKISV